MKEQESTIRRAESGEFNKFPPNEGFCFQFQRLNPSTKLQKKWSKTVGIVQIFGCILIEDHCSVGTEVSSLKGYTWDTAKLWSMKRPNVPYMRSLQNLFSRKNSCLQHLRWIFFSPSDYHLSHSLKPLLRSSHPGSYTFYQPRCHMFTKKSGKKWVNSTFGQKWPQEKMRRFI